MTPLVYILSPGHSGSTLLSLMIGAHPDVATVGELKFGPAHWRQRAQCSCGAAVPDCGFWRKIQQSLCTRGYSLDDPTFRTHPTGATRLLDRLVAGQVQTDLLETLRAAALRLWPAAGRTWRRLIDCNQVLAETILALSGRRLLLDSSKDASRLRYLLESAAFDVRVIYLIRDGRAVSYSMIRKGLDPGAAARDWVHEHEQARRLRRQLGASADWFELHYERLCEQPAARMADVCTFIGLRPDDRVLNYRDWESHVLGNRMRLGGDATIRLDTAWREQLVGPPRTIVEQITAGLNRQFGYG